jgi:biopolymer transport protein ExbD
MRLRRAKRPRPGGEASTDLELMPMLNVFIAIIPLLLLSAAFVQVSVIQANLPAAEAAAAPATREEPLDLAIFILPDGYVVRGHGIGAQAIPRSQDAAAAESSRARLAEVLKAIVAEHPDNREVRIVAQQTTRYEAIIEVMDISRAAGLPEAGLADASQEGS